MSEYQYYEFRAVDRPLTGQEMSRLRAISSRADITPTSFENTYNYGDFRGDPDALMKDYFDVFVYVANWGTHRFMLRVPGNTLTHRQCASYCSDDFLRARTAGTNVILTFCADELESGWEEGEGWMDSLLPLRADLLRGDLRALYLGWLLAVGREEVGDDQPEPPVPAGLRNLSAPLQSLVEFLDVDPDLLEAAAAASGDLELASPPRDLLVRWIAELPEGEKDALLVQAALGENMHFGNDMVRRFHAAAPKAAANAAQARRTAGELRDAAANLFDEKRRREEARKQRERQIEEQRTAAERAKRLKALAARGESAWAEVEQLIATKRPADYDRVVLLLADLRDIASGSDRRALFEQQVRDVAKRHSAKSSLIRRLREAGLQAG